MGLKFKSKMHLCFTYILDTLPEGVCVFTAIPYMKTGVELSTYGSCTSHKVLDLELERLTCTPFSEVP
jgi:hypothetical protein